MTARTYRIALVAMLGLGLVLVAIFVPRATAAERTLPEPYEINIYAPASSYGKNGPSENGPSIIPLQDGRHESREACRHAIMFVKIRESGVKLRCDPVETARVR